MPVVYYYVSVEGCKNAQDAIEYGPGHTRKFAAFIRSYRAKTPVDAIELWNKNSPNDLVVEVTLPYDIPDSDLPDMSDRAVVVWHGQRVKDFVND